MTETMFGRWGFTAEHCRGEQNKKNEGVDFHAIYIYTLPHRRDRRHTFQNDSSTQTACQSGLIVTALSSCNSKKLQSEERGTIQRALQESLKDNS